MTLITPILSQDQPAHSDSRRDSGIAETRRDSGIPEARRDSGLALRRGMRGLCPACGRGAMFASYLKVNDACPECGEELHHQRADDAPPYLTIFVVGHIVGGGMLTVETFADNLPIWIHALVWPTLALILSLWLLPIMKGGLIGWQWALKMHGFEVAPLPRAPKKAKTLGQDSVTEAGLERHAG